MSCQVGLFGCNEMHGENETISLEGCVLLCGDSLSTGCCVTRMWFLATNNHCGCQECFLLMRYVDWISRELGIFVG